MIDPAFRAPGRALPAQVLSRLLATAWTEMRRLRLQAEDFADKGRGTFSPRQVASLCAVLDQAADNLEGRMVYLGAAEAPPRPGPTNPRGARSLLGGYCSCCQRLGRALTGAKRAGDATTAWLLGDVISRLERQLWLLDPQSGAAAALSPQG
jgi:hypothetical protein